MLRGDCILTPRYNNDRRISVMSRHTLSDGITPDTRIVRGNSFDEHLVELSPPDTLIGDWYRGKLGQRSEETFVERFAPVYIDYLQRGGRQAMAELARRAINENILILCIEPTPPENQPLLCHRTILLSQCALLRSDLEIHIA